MTLEQSIIAFILKDPLEFAAIPFKSSPSSEESYFHSFFKICNKIEFLREVFENHYESIYDQNVLLQFYVHEFGKIDVVVRHKSPEFVKLQSLFEEHIFYHTVVTNIDLFDMALLDQYNYEVRTIIRDFLHTESDSRYIEYAKHSTDYDIHKIFSMDKQAVLDLVNSSKDQYALLKELNNPAFILENANGKLDISPDTATYFIQHVPITSETVGKIIEVFGFPFVFKTIGSQLELSEWVLHTVFPDDVFEILHTVKFRQIIDIEKTLVILKTAYPQMYPIFESKIKDNLQKGVL